MKCGRILGRISDKFYKERITRTNLKDEFRTNFSERIFKETGEKKRERRNGREETGERRNEREETREKKQERRNRKEETGKKKRERRNMREETGEKKRGEEMREKK